MYGRELARLPFLVVGPTAFEFLRFPVRVSHCRGRDQGVCSVSSSRPSNRACGSPAHGSPTSFAAGIRLLPPGFARPGRGDDSVQVDQAELVGREVQ